MQPNLFEKIKHAIMQPSPKIKHATMQHFNEMNNMTIQPSS